MHFCPQCIYELLFGSFLLCVIAKNSYKTYVWSEWVHFYKIIDLQKFQKEIRSMLWLQKKLLPFKQNSFDHESAPKNGFILKDILKYISQKMDLRQGEKIFLHFWQGLSNTWLDFFFVFFTSDSGKIQWPNWERDSL